MNPVEHRTARSVTVVVRSGYRASGVNIFFKTPEPVSLMLVARLLIRVCAIMAPPCSTSAAKRMAVADMPVMDCCGRYVRSSECFGRVRDC